MAASKPILYSYFHSSCSWRVRIALALKKVDYEYRPVNLLKGEQLSDDFSAINPSQEVPVLVDGGNTLTQSLPIIEYLEETRPNYPLLPKDPVLRAKVRAVAECIGSGIQPLHNLNVLLMVGDNKLDWVKHWIESGFRKLENLLTPIHGKCCVQDNVTIADLFLVPQVFNATTRFDIDLSKFPLICSINDHLVQLEEFKVSHPYSQPDYPQ